MRERPGAHVTPSVNVPVDFGRPQLQINEIRSLDGDWLPVLSKGITIRSLELFEATVRRGSIAEAARLCSLSLPAASQQISNLEMSLGVTLLDRSRRPLVPTPAGRVYLNRIKGALGQLRQASAELAVPDVAHLTSLKLGMIDDFDIEITPDLVLALARNLANCKFSLSTRPSHQILSLLAEGALDIGIAATSETAVTGTAQYMLLREPFVLVTPAGFQSANSGADILLQLPLLRYDRGQMLGRQIEAYLARHRISPADRFEIDSNQSIMALVASGAGYSITTPLALIRAREFLPKVTVAPLPLDPLAREIALYAREDLPGSIASDMAASMRVIILERLIAPMTELAPWLDAEFRIIEA
jgi:DNA-binding transcriptional LysR family regulator